MHVCIIGAGPVGLLQCLHLLKVKDEMEANLKEGPVTISIFEGRGQQDLVDSSPNQRSINLALSWRGMKSLEAVGLLQQVLKDATPMAGRMIHPTTKESRPFAQAYSFHPNEVSKWQVINLL
jgi:kynurenine 3-monooxygenase